jgi:hypothetical protein
VQVSMWPSVQYLARPLAGGVSKPVAETISTLNTRYTLLRPATTTSESSIMEVNRR